MRGVYPHKTGPGANHWKGGLPVCSICSKKLTNYNAKFCAQHKPSNVEGRHWKLAENKKGHLIGRKMSDLTKEKLRISNLKRVSDGTHNNYKGENVGYRSLHHWVERKLGKATICTNCSKEGGGRQIHWANMDHKYRRITSEWLSLCALCHHSYDKINNLRKN